MLRRPLPLALVLITLPLSSRLAFGQDAPDVGKFVVVQSGTIPVIVSAPHGGGLLLPGVPERKGGDGVNKFVTVRDTGTLELAEKLVGTIEKEFGGKPYVVVAKFARKQLDANRPAEDGYEDKRAKAYYDAYHAALKKHCHEVRTTWGRGLLIDIHGQAAKADTIFRGTAGLKTVTALKDRFGMKSLTGPTSLLGVMAAKGYTIFPPLDAENQAKEDARYNGGHIVRTYGSDAGTGIDAVQLELGGDHRARKNQDKTATDLAVALKAFATVYLPSEKLPAAQPDRAALLKRMELVMGPLPGDARKVPLDVKTVSEEKLDGYVRRKITFAVETNDRVPAWVLIPTAATEGKRPAMLCLHQTIKIGKDEPVGLGVQESKRQALHLVKRGYICLAPDYPSFGEYPFDFKKSDFQSGTMKAIWNNMRAVDLLQALPGVDGKRIGVIGHSLGGHNSLFTAAFDERLKVTVTSCGFCSFAKYYNGNLTGWTSDRYMPRIATVYDKDPKKVPFDFDDVILSIAPRAVFVMAPLKDSNFDVTGVQDVIAKVSPAYKQLGAPNKLQALYPDAGHDWPEEARTEAYDFIDKWLK